MEPHLPWGLAVWRSACLSHLTGENTEVQRALQKASTQRREGAQCHTVGISVPRKPPQSSPVSPGRDGALVNVSFQYFLRSQHWALGSSHGFLMPLPAVHCLQAGHQGYRQRLLPLGSLSQQMCWGLA